jgi:hypothetical protein
MPPKQPTHNTDATPRGGSKRIHISPKKGCDKCLACETDLDDDSSAILCNGCEKWKCIDCMDMPEPEYVLITKISRRVEVCIKCPICKHSGTTPSSSSQNPSIESIVEATINNMKSNIIDKIPSQAVIQDIVQSSVRNLETTLKAEISKSISDVKAQVSALEHQVVNKCSISDVRADIQTLVQQETASIKNDFSQQ